MKVRQVSVRELHDLQATCFVVRRSYQGCKNEYEQRTLATCFGCPRDFYIAQQGDSYYVVQRYYCNVNEKPLLDDVAGKLYPDLRRYVDPTQTVMVSHLLELLLSSLDNPGEIWYNDPGLVVNYAIYDREHGGRAIVDYEREYQVQRDRLMRNLRAYGIEPTQAEMQYYENAFVETLKTCDIPRDRVEFHNAQLILDHHAPATYHVPMRPRRTAQYDSLATQVSQNTLNRTLHQRFQYQYFPRLALAATCYYLSEVSLGRTMALPETETVGNLQVKMIYRLLLQNFQAPVGYTYVGDATPSEVVDIVLQPELEKYNQHIEEKRIDGDVPSAVTVQRIIGYAQNNDLDTTELEAFLAHVRELERSNHAFYRNWMGHRQEMQILDSTTGSLFHA